jgi:succinate dehydrogenase / fumarate reductase cytochrome b subunit
MAVTGLVLFGFLIAHMLGNLQIFIPNEAGQLPALNHYAESLRQNMALLWGARSILLISVVLHAWAAIQLTAVKSAARPVTYVKPGNVQGSIGSRTMMLSGPVIALFVIGHLLHLTTGTLLPGFVHLQAKENVIAAFSNPIASILYIVAMIFVGFHLSHGIWSMFQTMGFSHPRYTPMLKKFSAVFSWLLIAGFISVPIAVLAGLVRI